MKHKTLLSLLLAFLPMIPLLGQNEVVEEDVDTMIVKHPDEWPYYDEPGVHFDRCITKLLVEKIDLYPKELLPEPAQIFFYYVVEIDGSVSSINVLSSGTNAMAECIKEVMLSLKGWTPAMKDGEKVRCRLFYTAYFDPQY